MFVVTCVCVCVDFPASPFTVSCPQSESTTLSPPSRRTTLTVGSLWPSSRPAPTQSESRKKVTLVLPDKDKNNIFKHCVRVTNAAQGKKMKRKCDQMFLLHKLVVFFPVWFRAIMSCMSCRGVASRLSCCR